MSIVDVSWSLVKLIKQYVQNIDVHVFSNL